MNESECGGTIALESHSRQRLLDMKSAAHVLGGITTRYLYVLLESGALEGVKQGRRRMITVASIDAYVDRLRAEASN